MKTLFQLLALLAVPAAAHAQVMDAIRLPEPETLSLLAIGAVAIVLAKRRGKR